MHGLKVMPRKGTSTNPQILSMTSVDVLRHLHQDRIYKNRDTPKMVSMKLIAAMNC